MTAPRHGALVDNGAFRLLSLLTFQTPSIVNLALPELSSWLHTVAFAFKRLV